MQAKYIAALESLEVLRNLRPGRCELTAAERASKRNEVSETVFAFLTTKTKNKDWLEKQDAVLASMGDVV